MPKFCLRHILSLFFIVIFFGLFLACASPIKAASCGNGICNPNETCASCPQDCGACPTDTPGPTPTSSIPTPTPGPGSTSTPSSGSSDSGTGTSTSSTVTIINFPSLTLSGKGSVFSGTAWVTGGTIDSVEYSLDEKSTWLQATATDGKFDEGSENYQFSPKDVSTIGGHSIVARGKSSAGIYTQAPNYASITFTISPPKITLDKFLPNPTKNQTPTITGVVTSNYQDISKVEISLDEEKTWFSTKLIGSKYSLTTKLLEDGNYQVRARAYDTAGNMGLSDAQTLIIDTIPPIIGGGMQSSGPQILTPDKSGVLRIVTGAEETITLSMKGGVTEAQIITPDASFDLENISGTNIWSGKIKFEKEGEKEIKISAVDGANNQTERNLFTILVEDSGKIIETKTGTLIKDATVAIYLFETTTKRWTLWGATPYGQANPQKTTKEGLYGFMVPPGKYYIEINAPGFITLQSEILDIQKTQILNFIFPLESKPKISLSLPFLGKLTLALPTIIPQTLKTSSLEKPAPKSVKSGGEFKQGAKAPELSLPDLSGNETVLSNYLGKKILLSFLSFWSTPSLEQAPILSGLSDTLSDNQQLLVVSLQESTATTETFMKRGKYKFPVLVDKNGQSAANYNITLLPQHFFIDSKGKIQEVYVGVISAKDALEKLANLP